ncbi:hypothetical protein CBOM_03629 [Ceraceosorus bombacis]|uniref:Uncharacterized protein n=1 Tax=Ceraceosorus bombacis TaxID=401625 RepID=A0A0P1BGF7_9BASI|nr:hypothetical protein CBOM_03629 [Ceraceosorus bombacis]
MGWGIAQELISVERVRSALLDQVLAAVLPEVARRTALHISVPNLATLPEPASPLVAP